MKTPTDMKTKAPSRGDLELMLRPAGGGIHVVSTGVAELQALQMTLYGAESPDDVMTKWRSSLDAIGDSPVVILGVPSDTGAGFTRGANRAPGAIRAHAVRDLEHPIRTVTDMGDVYTVPHYLYDELLSDQQRAATAEVL